MILEESKGDFILQVFNAYSEGEFVHFGVQANGYVALKKLAECLGEKYVESWAAKKQINPFEGWRGTLRSGINTSPIRIRTEDIVRILCHVANEEYDLEFFRYFDFADPKLHEKPLEYLLAMWVIADQLQLSPRNIQDFYFWVERKELLHVACCEILEIDPVFISQMRPDIRASAPAKTSSRWALPLSCLGRK